MSIRVLLKIKIDGCLNCEKITKRLYHPLPQNMSAQQINNNELKGVSFDYDGLSIYCIKCDTDHDVDVQSYKLKYKSSQVENYIEDADLTELLMSRKPIIDTNWNNY